MYETNVARGAEWLDEHFPNWVDKVDLDTLNQTVAYKCVLGQVSGSYYDQPAKVRCEKYGFELSYMGNDERWDQLTDAWKRLINERRKGAAINSWADSEPVEVSQAGLDAALDVIRSIHNNTDTYVPELTPQGALATLLMDLGIRIKVV